MRVVNTVGKNKIVLFIKNIIVAFIGGFILKYIIEAIINKQLILPLELVLDKLFYVITILFLIFRFYDIFIKNKINMKKKYKLIIGSPVDYEELVVYVEVDNEDLGLVHKEEGEDKIKFEFFNLEEKLTVDLDAFIEALQEAKKELLK